MTLASEFARLSTRRKIESLSGQLDREYDTFRDYWMELGRYFLPTRGRFLPATQEHNRGDNNRRRNKDVIDSTGPMGVRTLRSGLMGTHTNPARPWFQLSTPDPDLNAFRNVKIWLERQTQRMRAVQLSSNFYNAMPVMYGDAGVFATGCNLVLPDPDDVIRLYPQPIGSYRIATNDRGRVDTFIRRFTMTVRQLIERFGFDDDGNRNKNISTAAWNAWDRGKYESPIGVGHFIGPNDAFKPGSASNRRMRYTGVYYELSSDRDAVVDEGGHNVFPVVAWRWATTGEDVYGTDCPGMDALGDMRALQLLHVKKAKALDKQIDPPLVAPSSLRNRPKSMLPGGVTHVDEREQGTKLRQLHEVHASLTDVRLDIQEHQGRIRRAFYEDLFLMMLSSDRREITAREIDERREEKLVALIDAVDRLNDDCLDPIIDIQFDLMLRAGRIEQPPPELARVGGVLRVDYVSMMAQAQKMVGLASLERHTNYVMAFANLPEEHPIFDRFDRDEALSVHGDILGVAPQIDRGVDAAAARRQARAEAQAQAAQLERANVAAQTAESLSKSSLEGNNALTALAGR